MTSVLSPWLIWFLAGVLIMLAEMGAPGFVIMFFGVGCWAAAIVAAVAPDAFAVQVGVFIAVTLFSLLTLRKVAVRIFVGRSEGTMQEDTGNVQVGARVRVEVPLQAGRHGRVRFRGTMWTAVAQEDIAAGEEVEITGVDRNNRSCLLLRRVPAGDGTN